MHYNVLRVLQRTTKYSYTELQNSYNVLYRVLLLCTTKYHSALQSTIPHHAVLLHNTKYFTPCYDKVLLRLLQSATPSTKDYYVLFKVLLHTTYYSVLQSTTKYYEVLLRTLKYCTPYFDKVPLRTTKCYSSTTLYYSSTTLYYKVLPSTTP